MSNIIIGATIAVIAIIIAVALIASLTLRTKKSEAVILASRKIKQMDKKISEHIAESQRRNKLVLESMLAIMEMLRRIDHEGKFDEALKNLNNNIIK